MDIGIIRETARSEHRVALTPSGTQALVSAGHSVIVETRAGAGAGFSDQEYLAAGSDIAMKAREVTERCQTLVKVQAPQPEEIAPLKKGSLLAGFLHLSSHPELRTVIRDNQFTAISLELVEEPGGERPILDPLSEMGGRVAITMANHQLLVSGGGRGQLMGGVPGLPPMTVVVLGAGHAGESAARHAAQMGAQVAILDRDPRRLAQVLRRSPHIITAVASEYNLTRYVERADVLVGAIAIRGRPAPQVVRRHHIRMMREGAMFIDMSIDEGGCAETSRLPDDGSVSYVEEGVRHICIPNLPAEVARTSSRALANSFLPFLLNLAADLDTALSNDPSLRGACVFRNGKLVHPAVASFTGEPLEA